MVKDTWAVETFDLGTWTVFAQFDRSDYAWITAQHIQALIDLTEEQERPPGYMHIGSKVRVKRFNINHIIEIQPPWNPKS